MPGELGEALSPSPPSTADRANGQECQRCPNATLILFFFGVDTQGIYMRPASPTLAAVGQQTLELLQCPVWPGTGAGQTLPAMLTPSNASSCHLQPATWARLATTYWRQFFICVCSVFFPAPSCSLWLPPAPTRTGRFIPHCHHFRDKDQTLTSPVQREKAF